MNKDTARRLRYASGYLALEMLNDASAELEAIPFGDRLSEPVLAVRYALRELTMVQEAMNVLLEAETVHGDASAILALTRVESSRRAPYHADTTMPRRRCSGRARRSDARLS